jgi:hypothetical protein
MSYLWKLIHKIIKRLWRTLPQVSYKILCIRITSVELLNKQYETLIQNKIRPKHHRSVAFPNSVSCDFDQELKLRTFLAADLHVCKYKWHTKTNFSSPKTLLKFNTFFSGAGCSGKCKLSPSYTTTILRTFCVVKCLPRPSIWFEINLTVLSNDNRWLTLPQRIDCRPAYSCVCAYAFLYPYFVVTRIFSVAMSHTYVFVRIQNVGR